MNGLTSTNWARIQPSLWRPNQQRPQKRWDTQEKRACATSRSQSTYVVTLIILSSLTLTTVALAAEDTKAYPGAACQPLNNTANFLRDAGGRIFKGGTEAQELICPVVKDISADNDPEFARISAIGDLRCTFRARGPLGDGAANASPTSVIPGPVVQLQFGLGDVNIDVGVKSGYYYFLCSVPGRGPEGQNLPSGVVSYLVTENDDED